MPVWGKTAEAALWVPALMYFGADVYDKYKNDILYTELLQNSKMQFSKPKKLLSFSSVENL